MQNRIALRRRRADAPPSVARKADLVDAGKLGDGDQPRRRHARLHAPVRGVADFHGNAVRRQLAHDVVGDGGQQDVDLNLIRGVDAQRASTRCVLNRLRHAVDRQRGDALGNESRAVLRHGLREIREDRRQLRCGIGYGHRLRRDGGGGAGQRCGRSEANQQTKPANHSGGHESESTAVRLRKCGKSLSFGVRQAGDRAYDRAGPKNKPRTTATAMARAHPSAHTATARAVLV